MVDLLFVTVVLAGAVAAVGCWLVIASLVPGHARLADALAVLDGDGGAQQPESGPAIVADAGSRLEWFGAWLYQHGRLPLSAQTARRLTLQGRSVADYFVHKLVLGMAGLLLPNLLAWTLAPLVPALGMVPLGLGLVAGVFGWLWPDIAMRQQQHQTNADAEEALNTLFDLVALERLANLSATQSLEAAAGVSDAPVFVSVRAALERARLEQRAPWPDLHRLGRELDLPQLGDMADVLRLDEQGAALAEVLMGRVRELRDAHLTRERTNAHRVSESMTVWMAIPVVIFALAFLTPPLLRIVGLE